MAKRRQLGEKRNWGEDSNEDFNERIDGKIQRRKVNKLT